MSLNLTTLRAANVERLPLFKNREGKPAHSKPDGSDWSPAMWLVAMMGEVGELGEATNGGNPHEIAKESADVLTYLDIFALRALDCDDRDIQYGVASTEAQLLHMIVTLGKMCEDHKKYVRADMPFHKYRERRGKLMAELAGQIFDLDETDCDRKWVATTTSTHGIDLGRATIEKFNEVSERVGCNVHLY